MHGEERKAEETARSLASIDSLFDDGGGGLTLWQSGGVSRVRVEEEIRLARDRAEMLGELQVNMCFRRGIASKFQRPSMLSCTTERKCARIVRRIKFL